MKIAEKKNYYSLNDLITELGLSRKTLIKYIRTGRIEAFRLGKAYRVTQESLDKYIAREKVVK